MAVKTIDRATLHVIQTRVLATVKALEAELGVTFSLGNGTYGSATGSVTLRMAVADSSGAAQSVPEAEFKRYATIYDLQPDDLGREFEVRGTVYTLIGAQPSARKYPLLGKRRDGTVFKFTAATVKASLRPRPASIPAMSGAFSASASRSAQATGAAAKAMQDRLFA